MFELWDLAVQTSLIVLATPQNFRLSLSYRTQTGENDSSFQEMNLVTEESLTNAQQEPTCITPSHHYHKSLPRSLYLFHNSF